MALIVSDGTGLADADSYISLIDARDYATKYGYTLPIDDTEAEVALRKGAVYANLYESSFSGERLKDQQSLAFPRINAYKCYGASTIDIASDAIPEEVKQSQVIAAQYYGQGLDARANDDQLSIASKEVTGAVKVSYFDNGKTGKSVMITASVDALTPLLCNKTLYSARTVRV